MLRSSDAGRKRSPSRPCVALFAARGDRHTRELKAAFARRGVAAVSLRLEDCDFDSESPFGLRLANLAEPPIGAIVRTVSAGSFEAVTRRLGVLHALRALGVPVWNDATAIERCVDKSMTTFLLARAGLPVPPSWTVEGIDAARRLVAL